MFIIRLKPFFFVLWKFSGVLLPSVYPYLLVFFVQFHSILNNVFLKIRSLPKENWVIIFMWNKKRCSFYINLITLFFLLKYFSFTMRIKHMDKTRSYRRKTACELHLTIVPCFYSMKQLEYCLFCHHPLWKRQVMVEECS